MQGNRRPLIVLASLIGAMTLASAVLLALDPGPTTRITAVSLSAVGVTGRPADVIFDTSPQSQPDRWSRIVIYESGTLTGSAQKLTQMHESVGRDGLGYHFVVGNGTLTSDGQIQSGHRWRAQQPGDYATGPYKTWYDQNAIGICLVGQTNAQPPTDAQMRELLWLVQQLQRRFNIPASDVMLQSDIDPAAQPGRFFPLAQLRQNLLQ